jgi:hypothetical protein
VGGAGVFRATRNAAAAGALHELVLELFGRAAVPAEGGAGSAGTRLLHGGPDCRLSELALPPGGRFTGHYGWPTLLLNVDGLGPGAAGAAAVYWAGPAGVDATAAGHPLEFVIGESGDDSGGHAMALRYGEPLWFDYGVGQMETRNDSATAGCRLLVVECKRPP